MSDKYTPNQESMIELRRLARIDNYDPKGLEFEANGKQMMYCYPDCERESLRGWLCYRHPDGQWVTLRKATDADVAAINSAVVTAHHYEATHE